MTNPPPADQTIVFGSYLRFGYCILEFVWCLVFVICYFSPSRRFESTSRRPALPGWVVINGWWEWPPATIPRVIAVKNRSHNPKTTKIKLQSFFFD